MKTYGIGARCSICGIEPFSSNDPKGLGYTLRRFDPSGRPTSSPDGLFFCEGHFPPQKRIPRAAAVTPNEAVEEFERLLAAASARLEEMICGAADDDDDVDGLLAPWREEIERGIVALKRTIVPREAPPPDGQLATKRKSKRRLPSIRGKHKEQLGPPVSDALRDSHDEAVEA